MSEISLKRKIKNETQIARARGNLYKFLARFYGREPDIEFLRHMRESGFIRALSDLGIEFDEDFLEQSEKELLDKMITEYTRLFIGPGKHISPHESVHRKGEGLLWGDSTVKVKKFIRATGLEYRSDFKGMPDHISVELEFMHRLLEAEEEAREKKELTKLKKILNLQRRFIDEHILKWIPQFADKIIDETKLDFCQKIALLTKEFILLEVKELNVFGKEGEVYGEE